MKSDYSKRILFWVMHLIVVVFLGFYLVQGNYEFISYAVIVVALLWFFSYLDSRFTFPFVLWIGFSIWILFHMVGGLVLYGHWMYGFMLLNLIGDPYYILRYDQFVHFFCYVVVGAGVYYVVSSKFGKRKELGGLLIFICMVAALGIGALNEIFEFGVATLVANTGVGDYFNTSLDLVFNFVGAVVGVLLAKKYQ